MTANRQPTSDVKSASDKGTYSSTPEHRPIYIRERRLLAEPSTSREPLKEGAVMPDIQSTESERKPRRGKWLILAGLIAVLPKRLRRWKRLFPDRGTHHTSPTQSGSG